MSEQTHRSDPRVLNRRTLERDHRTLAKPFRPGWSSSTSAAQVAAARQQHGSVPNLRFEEDALDMSFEGRFDTVTAARTLQWLTQPAEAMVRMKKAGEGEVAWFALAYNHDYCSWEPVPPAAFRRFKSRRG